MNTLHSVSRASKWVRTVFSNKYYVAIFLLFLISFSLRLHFRSNYLDDWDSIQFVMGLKDYSIAAHQPHPPGYPLYIFIGRIFNVFISDSLPSFTFVSAFFGGLSLIPTYLLAKEIFGDRVGFLSAVLLSLAPAHVLFSEVVMTDIVSLFFITFTAYMLYLGTKSARYLYFASFMVGITAGIRMTDISMIFLLFIVIIYVKNIKYCVISVLLVLMGIGIWFIPIILDTGLNTLISALIGQWSYNSETSTLSSLGGLSPLNLFLTSKILANILISGWSLAFIVLVSEAIYIGFIKLQCIKCRSLNRSILDIGPVFVLSWLLIYLVFSLLNNNLYICRYLLPLFPPIAIIFSYSIIKLLDIQNSTWKIISLYVLLSISLILMGSQALAAAHDIHTTSPPPVDAAYFIQEHYDPNDVVIVAYGSFRHFQYYIPQYNVKFYDPSSIDKVLEENSGTIVSDFPITFNGSELVYESKRDHNIYPKHDNVELYNNNMNRMMHIFILKGWHDIENWNDTPTRWMSDDATLLICSEKNRSAELSLQALSFYQPRTLKVRANGDPWVYAEIPDQSFTIVTAPINLHEGINTIQFYVPEGCEKACDVPELKSEDRRCLSIAVQNVTVACINNTCLK